MAILRLGIIARSDNTGLGNQTRELVNMLNPDKILLIDSSHFNGNVQHPEWYQDSNVMITTRGFASNKEVSLFLRDLDAVLSCEIFYNSSLIAMAKKKNVKTILQYNYEFLDYLNNDNLMFPDVLLSPSYWELDTVKSLFSSQTIVAHIPPPTTPELFLKARNTNANKTHGRILHIGGKAAVKDRNGTQTVIKAMEHVKSNIVLDIKTQSHIDAKGNEKINIIYDNVINHADMYEGYDAMILPRRFAGLCLPMNEALMSALPVFMTDISPNNQILPKEWLVKSNKIDTLITRTLLDVYAADPVALAKAIDDFYELNIERQKSLAYGIGYSNFAPDNLKQKYLDLIHSI